MTEWMNRCDRPGQVLDKWDRTKRYTEQPDDIPSIFKDALSVREAVYHDEQGVPLEAEVDNDDYRSFHFVMYASVAKRGAPSSPAATLQEEERRRSVPSAVRTPAATIRLIPPPHGPNPYKPTHPSSASSPTLNEGHHPTEPYIKLGRLATLKSLRGLGLSRQLIHAALDFAAKNPHEILPPRSPVSIENLKGAGSPEEQEEALMGWQGLVMIHAQADVEGMWKRFGFSETLLRSDGSVEIPQESRWMEEGIEHLAMWLRVPITYGRKTQTMGGSEVKPEHQLDWENL